MADTPRTFVKPELIDTQKGIITINDTDEIHHLKNVQRLKENNTIIVVDNTGNCYICKADKITNNEITLTINKHKQVKDYPDINITLIQGLVKGEKQDLIIQKNTELGVKKIIMLTSEHSTVKLKCNDDINKKINRWNKIALNASKQSKRAFLPEISFISDLDTLFNSYIKKNKNILLIACMEDKETINIKSALKSFNFQSEDILVFIGPEGGWSEHERELFNKNNALKVSLGDNILRAETASLIAIGNIIYEYEFE